MAPRLLRFVRAFVVLSLYSAAFVQSATFPSINELVVEFYTAEVQITQVNQATAAYATEYYDNLDDRGAVKLFFEGDLQSIYFDNSTFQIIEVNEFNCTVWDEDISDYDYSPIFYGWLNKDPLVIGPSAPLWYAQTRRNDIVDAGKETVRDIECDKFELPIINKVENLTIEYYFAPEDWTTPYKYNKLRVPIRIRVSGKSARFAAFQNISVDVDQISDFAYFKPSIDDFNNLLPPIGLGCRFKQEQDDMPPTPKVFMYSAEVVDLLSADAHEDIEVQFQKTWYDHTRLIARKDKYSRKNGYRSVLFDFNTGTMYRIMNDGSCQMDILRNSEFQVYDFGMTSRMMTPEEALNLDGTFYEMGKREIRGIRCDTYESVVFDEYFMDKQYYKLVVTAYFTEDYTNVGVNGEIESRIPVYYIITGYSSPSNKTLQLQYNIFEFYDVIWPEMYSSFRLDRCYAKAESKAYFVLILEVGAKDAAKMEDQDELIIRELRSLIAQHAKVPEMRIPYLKADYKPTGVFVTGVMLERPPALLQFYKIDTGPTVTNDPDIKIIPDAENLEQCSYACVDEGDFPCKGFYFCGRACFLKSTDPFEKEDLGEKKDLGECTEYIRGEIESSNFRQAYLSDALGYLETAVLNQSLAVEFEIPGGEEVVKVQDIIVGDGPYTGVDTGDKPFTLSVEFRKLDGSLETTRVAEYADTLHDCYKRCKEDGSLCSSFSYCPESPKENKECMISSQLVIKGATRDTDLVPDKYCNVYNLKFSDYFEPYPEKVSLLPGDKVIRSVEALEKCAASCRMEVDFKCRGFEYCRSMKTCTLHTKHILDLKPGETGSTDGRQCLHYAARYIADYMDLGTVLVEDNSNVRYGTSLEECAKICSEDLKENCKSFNFCPSVDFSDSTCALSKKLLRDDGITTTDKKGCLHYEKRDIVHDWDNNKAKMLSQAGFTKKGFTGIVMGMLVLGLVIGALGFIFYSYVRSRSSNEGMAVRFMKNES